MLTVSLTLRNAMIAAAMWLSAIKLRSRFFVLNQQLAKPVEPAMAHLDHPAPCRFCWVGPLGIGFLAPTNDMRDVAMRFDDLQCTPASIAGVGTQMLAAVDRRKSVPIVRVNVSIRDWVLARPSQIARIGAAGSRLRSKSVNCRTRPSRAKEICQRRRGRRMRTRATYLKPCNASA